MEATWGVYDGRDGVWLGNDDGPFAYPDREAAEVVAEIFAVRLNHEDGRLVALPTEKADRKRDEVACERTLKDIRDEIGFRRMSKATGIPVERLKLLESGETIQTREENNAILAYVQQRG